MNHPVLHGRLTKFSDCCTQHCTLHIAHLLGDKSFWYPNGQRPTRLTQQASSISWIIGQNLPQRICNDSHWTCVHRYKPSQASETRDICTSATCNSTSECQLIIWCIAFICTTLSSKHISHWRHTILASSLITDHHLSSDNFEFNITNDKWHWNDSSDIDTWHLTRHCSVSTVLSKSGRFGLACHVLVACCQRLECMRFSQNFHVAIKEQQPIMVLGCSIWSPSFQLWSMSMESMSTSGISTQHMQNQTKETYLPRLLSWWHVFLHPRCLKELCIIINPFLKLMFQDIIYLFTNLLSFLCTPKCNPVFQRTIYMLTLNIRMQGREQFATRMVWITRRNCGDLSHRRAAVVWSSRVCALVFNLSQHTWMVFQKWSITPKKN